MFSQQSDRRLFLKTGALLSAGFATPIGDCFAASKPASPNERLSIGIMGMGSRGGAIAKGMLGTEQVDIAYVCDVDERATAKALETVNAKQPSKKAVAVSDFRQILDDPKVDALICSAPNHWHAPATILGCSAGKHVYVEKPCCHTPAEGELAVAAARKNNRIVQMGTQRRSWPAIVEAIGKIQAGDIGDVLYSRTWYNNRRASIGKGKLVDPPAWLDWELWQGPCEHRQYKDNVVHYNWHWHWHWGNGELGNNGVHGLDVARWGLGVTYPERVIAGGGKYRHDDDQETPDTMMVTYEFPEDKTATWEGLSWSPLGPHDSSFGISFHGTKGSVVIRGSGYTMFDLRGKEKETFDGRGGDADHFLDFIDSARSGKRPNADISEAHQSTLLCHLGNISFRESKALDIDPSNGHIKDQPVAEKHWSKNYAPGWKPELA